MRSVVTDQVAGLSVGLCAAKTAEPIERLCGLWTQMGLNHVLDGGPDPPWEGAILRGGRGVPL